MKDQKITKETVKRLAELVKLTLSEQEIEQYTSAFSDTIDVMGKLSELDVQGVAETANLADLDNITFEDGADSSRTFTQADALANAQETDGENFLVSKILDK